MNTLYYKVLSHDSFWRTISTAAEKTLGSTGDDRCAPTGCGRFSHAHGAALRLADQSVLSQRPACQLWQACADADSGADQLCGNHAGALALAVLGREPAGWAPAL